MERHPSPPNRSRWKRRAFILLISCVALAGIIGLATFGHQKRQKAEQIRLRSEIDKHLDTFRAAGEPLTAQDLARLYPDPPPGQDVYGLLSSALSRLSIPKEVDHIPLFGTAKLPHGATRLDEAMRSAIQELVDTNRPALTAAEGIDLTRAWLVTGISRVFTNATIPRVGPLIQLSKLLALDGVLKMEAGDGKGATKAITQAYRIGRSCHNFVLILQSAGRAIEGASCASVERLLNIVTPSPRELEVFSQILSDEDATSMNRLLGAIRAQDLFFMEMSRGMASQTISKASTPLGRIFATYTANRIYNDQDLLTFLDWHEKLRSSLKLSSRQQLDFVKTNTLPRPTNPRQSSIAMLSVPSDLSRLFRGEARGIAALRITRTSLAIERWRLAHEGRLPGSLAELVPAFLSTVPTDPFDDQPLRFRKLSRGYQVYSIGMDFTDDGGKEQPAEAKETDHYDITFTVER